MPVSQTSPAVQEMPQAPQFAGSVARSAQTVAAPVPHSARGAPQTLAAVGVHEPAAQTWPAGHAFPQTPQFEGSSRRSLQATAVPAMQAARGSAQVVAHVPFEHISPGPHA
jgi:hypothetical protein